MKKYIQSSLLLSLLLFFVSVSHADVTPEVQCKNMGIDYQHAVKVVSALQKAIKNDNQEALARFIDYPLRVNKTDKDGKPSSLSINTSDEFVKQYMTIITPEMQKEIMAVEPTAISCNAQGAMIANGMLWFTTNKGLLTIYSINQN